MKAIMQLSLDQDGKYARGGLGSGTADCRLCALDDVKQRAALRFTVVDSTVEMLPHSLS